MGPDQRGPLRAAAGTPDGHVPILSPGLVLERPIFGESAVAAWLIPAMRRPVPRLGDVAPRRKSPLVAFTN